MTRSRRGAGTRRKKSSTGTLALSSTIAAILTVGAVSTAVFVLKSGSGSSASPAGPTAQAASAVPMPTTGEPRTMSSTDGFTYEIAAVSGGQKADGRAYIDYTITNKGRDRAPLETPGDLFLPRGKAGSAKCMPQPGAASDRCTLDDTSDVTAYLNGSKPPISDGTDQYMPGGASYLIRISTKEKVDPVTQKDLALYVWDVRFTRDRKAVLIPFP